MTALQRYVDAQDDGSFDAALAELAAGRKTGHWIWFVFPQLAGLGRSQTSRYFALAGPGEAADYLGHALLGARLVEAAQTLLTLPAGTDIERVLGGLDALNLRSSMTLFEVAEPGVEVFAAVLDRFFDGRRDQATLDLI